MRSLACLLSLFALSWGCASPQFDDAAAASPALGSQEWAAREAEWSHGFTHAFFDEEVGVASWELQGLNLEDEGVMLARVRAVLTRAGKSST
jgi:hypothetical protein